MNNELYHHGILGQKWGVRRFQNSDGSLTEEGKKRYSNTKWGYRSALKVKKNTKYVDSFPNRDAASKKWSKKLADVDAKYMRNPSIDTEYEFFEIQRKGLDAIRKGTLLDLGFSEEAAEAGAAWFRKHGWNIAKNDGIFIW